MRGSRMRFGMTTAGLAGSPGPAAKIAGLALLSAITGLYAAGAAAAPVGWPGSSAPCNATLQACIDGVGAGITIEVRTSTPIDENLRVNRSIGLVAARFTDARLAPGRDITATVSGTAAWDLTLRGIGLTDGGVDLRHASSGAANLVIEDLRIDGTPSGSESGIRVAIEDGAASTVRVAGNHVRGQSNLLAGLIEVRARGISGTHVADIRWNRVEARGVADGWGILASATNGATVTFQIFANEARGAFGRDGIGVSEGLFSTVPSTVTARMISNVVIGGNDGGFSGGLGSVVANGTTTAQIINNTVVRGRGILLSRWGGGSPPSSGTTGGSIFNNLIVANRFGLQNVAPSGTATNNYNLFSANQNPGTHTPGANDVNADPLLRSLDAPRLSPGSPAIDAGNSLALIGGGSLPLLDGDGLRRLVRGDGAGAAAVDIGAYEYGHRMLLAPSNNASANFFPIRDAAVTASNQTRLFTALNRTINPSTINPRPIGVFYSAPEWLIFNQDLSAMSTTLAYNVFHPLPSTTLSMRTVGATWPAFANAFAITGPDNDDLVFAEQNWNGDGAAGVYNNHPIAVGIEGGTWFVHNADGAALPAGAKFNVYWQPPSPNVFAVSKSAGDTLTSSAMLIDHPLLNGTPCAQFIVVPESPSPAADASGAIFDLVRANSPGGAIEQMWRLFSHSGSTIGQTYHVLVVPEQISDCTKGPLFRDQFEQ